MHKILFTKKAEKELSNLPSEVRRKATTAFDEMVTLGVKSSNTKKLQTPFPGYRKRIGDYRILFELNDAIIIVYKISKRSEAYR
jgi:mRNA interferase RelE/StbE